MRILVADDDRISRHVLQKCLETWGHDVEVAEDGEQALRQLTDKRPPPLAIVDWMMPRLDGLSVCRNLRATEKPPPIYIILLTAKGEKADIVEGLESGANDYLIKPFHVEELRARVGVGIRMAELQIELSRRVHQLENALAQVQQLEGMLPICAYCKKVRDDKDYWHEVESYISTFSDVRFSHGICPDCLDKAMK